MKEGRAVVLMQQVTGSEELKMSIINIYDLLQYFIEQYTLKRIKTLFDFLCLCQCIASVCQCEGFNNLILLIK
jgi:hypothetical protein